MRREVLEESARVMQETANALAIVLIRELPNANAKRAAVTLHSLSRNHQRHSAARKILANVAGKVMLMAMNGSDTAINGSDTIVHMNFDDLASALCPGRKH